MKEDEVHGQCDNSLLIEVVKSVAVLTSKFDSFEKVVNKVDRKVDALDTKLEKMKETYDIKINDLQKAPLKDKADKFESIAKLVIETIIAAALVVVLAKIGLK